MKKDPLKDWSKTTLWIRVHNGPLVEIDVLHPSSCSDEERICLLEKHAAQGVKIIRQLTGTKALIIQGQYKAGLNL